MDELAEESVNVPEPTLISPPEPSVPTAPTPPQMKPANSVLAVPAMVRLLPARFRMLPEGTALVTFGAWIVETVTSRFSWVTLPRALFQYNTLPAAAPLMP